jgi:hypothetical protein
MQRKFVYFRPMKIKGLIFLLLCLTCQPGVAQSFSLFYHDQKLSADTVLVRAGTTDSLDLTTFLTIRNDAETEMQIQAKKTEISMAPGTACSLCWAGYCYPAEIFQTDYPLDLAPGASDFSCFAHFITAGIAGTSNVRWTYFDQDNPEDSVSVVINYITYPMGIGNPNATVRIIVAPNPADGEVLFRLSSDVDSELTVQLYTLSGISVLSGISNNYEGLLKLNTSTVPTGIYLYSIREKGKLISTGKLVVRR